MWRSRASSPMEQRNPPTQWEERQPSPVSRRPRELPPSLNRRPSRNSSTLTAKQNLGTLPGRTYPPPRRVRPPARPPQPPLPQHVAAIAEAFASVGRTLPPDELVRLHNRYSNAARGVGEKLSLDNSRMLHLIQAPALSREGAGHLLMAIRTVHGRSPARPDRLHALHRGVCPPPNGPRASAPATPP